MNNLQVIEYRGKRVLTSQQLAEVYGTDSKTISYNFNYNRSRYIEGKHFICLTGDELKRYKTNPEIHESSYISGLKKVLLCTPNPSILIQHGKSMIDW